MTPTEAEIERMKNPPQQTREEKFVAGLDKSIAFHRANQNDPHGIGNAVIASLAEVRSAFVAAYGLKG